jgi:hypothetical protein
VPAISIRDAGIRVFRGVTSQGGRLSRTLRWLLELTLPRHDDTTTRRAVHFDGFCPLAAPRFARRQE